MRTTRLALILLVTVLLAWACARDESAHSEEPPVTPSASNASPTASPSPGLLLRLREGQETGGREERPPAPPAAPLSEAEVKAILARLPAFTAGSSQQADFALRPSSLPAPRTGATVQQPWPPPLQADKPDTGKPGPLEVLRFAPEGDVPIVPQVSVTFSQPMVPVTSQDEASKIQPVKLTPQPPGQWRWVGTKTILFDPQDQRMPMATKYTVEVPAGTKSETAGTLAAAKTWTFTTPTPTLTGYFPNGGSQPLHPLIFLAFDQRVDPAAVLKTVHVQANGQDLPTRLATEAEIAADAQISSMSGAQQPGRFVVLRTVSKLPGDTSIAVNVGPGTPSVEGPLTTKQTQSFGFRTYGPLRILEHRCGWGDDDCPPMTPWQIRFSNSLDPQSFDPEKQLVITPELPGMKASVGGDWLNIYGRSKGRTTYSVTVKGSVKDVFGQTLGQDVTLKFQVGPARPALHSVGGPLVVVDPKGKAVYSVYTVNQPALKVRLYQVTPEDWKAYQTWQREAWRDPRPAMPGKKVFDAQVPVKAPPDEMAETGIDLTPALTSGLGQVIVVVEPTVFEDKRYRTEVSAWVQVTTLGLEAFMDANTLIGWTSALENGAPQADVQLRVPGGASGVTGADGLATIPLPTSGSGDDVLIATKGNDVAFLPQGLYGGRGWVKRGESTQQRWFVFDDRGLYKPGERVHLKGWIRNITPGTKGDVELVTGLGPVAYVLRDSRGNDILKGSAPVTALGGFELTLDLPGTMNLGHAYVQFNAPGGGTSHAFRVEEFRRPEFEVAASVSDGVKVIGESATATVTASYFAGGPLPNADVNWSVTSSPGHFSPPGWDEFTFGTWTPWWDYEFYGRPSASGGQSQTFASRTDSSGKHRLQMDFLAVHPARPTAVEAAAAVSDVNRQTWSASTSVLVHSGTHYVGLKPERTFVEAGQPLRLEAIVPDLDGKAQAGRPIKLRSARLDWDTRGGEWREKEVDVTEQTLTSGAQPVKAEIRPREGGTYRITASVTDAKGRPNETEITLWVAGGKTPQSRNVEQEKVLLIPDRKDYQPGQVAEILVQAPFTPAEGVLTLRRSGLVKTERFRMDSSTYTLKVPIEESYLPNLYVQVDLVGASDRPDAPKGSPKRPAYGVGSLNLSIPPVQRTLTLTAAPRTKGLEPGGSTVLDVVLKDAAGKPVQGGEVAVVVADEAVLALTGYDIANPLGVFYTNREAGVEDYHLRGFVQLASDSDLERAREEGDARGGAADGAVQRAMPASEAMMESGAMPPAPAPSMAKAAMNGDMEAPGGAPGPAIRMRSDFNPLALFRGAVPTDAQGRAQVALKVPDNLTRYRITAVAVAGGKQFGKGEDTVTARLPLMVRPSAPRFLNFGDRFELPVVVQNQTDRPLEVSVAVRTANLTLTQGAGRRLTVPANDRVEVRFPAAADKAGKAAFQVGAVSGDEADAAEVSLPVWTPATTEAFATYGTLDQGSMVQPVQAPKDVWPQFGGLEITTSSTALQELTDAVLYLVEYPFECAEQVSSRVLAVAALKDVLTAFQAEGLPSAKEMKAAMARDVEHLRALQRPDGSFGFWRRDDLEFPYVSVHAAHALIRAKTKGFAVPQDMLDRSKSYLQDVESHIPADYGPAARRAIIAYALNVRQLMGDADPTRAKALVKEAGLDGLSLEGIGWILPTLSKDPVAAEIRRYLDNKVTETAGTAHFVTSYGDAEYLLLASDRRADGVVLDALIQDQPKSDLIPKIVRGLLAHRTRGRWENTQENVFILLALDRYFNTYEKVTPNFVARAWLGESFAGEQKFQGRSADSKQLDIPMSWLAKTPGKQDLVMAKDGPGRLYYRLGMRYAPKNLMLAPADHGFTVERAYEAVDDPKDVTRDADGTWRVKAGARVRVRVTMVAPTRRYHVALVDPLPAGLEALNPALAMTETVPGADEPTNRRSQPGHYWWWGPWWEHQNLRDERAEAFCSLLWEGVYDYSYTCRATTPGDFVVPPPKAEEMYHPETFGRGATARVIVE